MCFASLNNSELMHTKDMKLFLSPITNFTEKAVAFTCRWMAVLMRCPNYQVMLLPDIPSNTYDLCLIYSLRYQIPLPAIFSVEKISFKLPIGFTYENLILPKLAHQIVWFSSMYYPRISLQHCITSVVCLHILVLSVTPRIVGSLPPCLPIPFLCWYQAMKNSSYSRFYTLFIFVSCLHFSLKISIHSYNGIWPSNDNYCYRNDM